MTAVVVAHSTTSTKPLIGAAWLHSVQRPTRSDKQSLPLLLQKRITLFWSSKMNYANLIAGVSALHHINQEPQITLIRATLDLSRIKRALSCLFPKFTN